MNRRDFLKLGSIALAAYSCAASGMDYISSMAPLSRFSKMQGVDLASLGNLPEKESLERRMTALESLSGIYRMCPELADAFDEFPEFTDGVDYKDRAAVETLYHAFKDLNFPKDLCDGAYGEHNKHLLKPEHYAILDMVNAGKGDKRISVPLREMFLMVRGGNWDKKDVLKQLGWYESVLTFVWNTDWKYFNNEDWKRWEDPNYNYNDIVKYKTNLATLIKKHQWLTMPYVSDNIDIMRPPSETRKKNTGKRKRRDCEDLAAEAADRLEKSGIYDNVEVTSVLEGGGRGGHAFTTYKKKGDSGIYVLDNVTLSGEETYIRKFNSIVEAGRKIAEENFITPNYIFSYDWRTFIRNYRNFSLRDSLI